jgi:hypothetical protein
MIFFPSGFASVFHKGISTRPPILDTEGVRFWTQKVFDFVHLGGLADMRPAHVLPGLWGAPNTATHLVRLVRVVLQKRSFCTHVENRYKIKNK